MTYTPIIYDWRNTIQPNAQFFRAGGVAVMSGTTIGGASVENPEPGGRAELMLEFDGLALASANLDASWLLSRFTNGAIMRIALFQPTVQLVADASFGGSTDAGVAWSNGLAWSGGAPWHFDPSAGINGAGTKGGTTFRCNMSTLGQVLSIGHVIGFHLEGYDFAHMVVNISYSSTNTATVTVQPPLRRDVTVNDRVKFRPMMLVTCINAREAAGQFRYGVTMALNAMQLVEALV